MPFVNAFSVCAVGRGARLCFLPLSLWACYCGLPFFSPPPSRGCFGVSLGALLFLSSFHVGCCFGRCVSPNPPLGGVRFFKICVLHRCRVRVSFVRNSVPWSSVLFNMCMCYLAAEFVLLWAELGSLKCVCVVGLAAEIVFLWAELVKICEFGLAA